MALVTEPVAPDPAVEGEPAFCGTCPFAVAGLAQSVDRRAVRELALLVQHSGPLAAGQHLFREGDVLQTLAAVRAGCLKTYVVDANGREQVRGFHLQGDLVGLDAIDTGRHPTSAVALSDSTLCRFSFPRITTLATRLPRLTHALLRLLSRDIGVAASLAGDHPAPKRLAAFIVGLARRGASDAAASRRLRLPMTRADIASYLRLTPETVSRLLRRFRDDGLLDVDGRNVRILDPGRLEEVGRL